VSEPSIAEFNSRIERIQKARGHGLGFEAPGTLGRSFYTHGNPRKRRLPLLRPLIVTLLLGTMLKALFLFQLGPESYEARVAVLMQGTGLDPIGGWLMQADPMTVTVARQIASFHRLGS
jgi:hypothetical protein